MHYRRIVVVLLVAVIGFAALFYNYRVIHIGNLYWVDFGKNEYGLDNYVLLHKWKVCVDAPFDVFAIRHPYLYIDRFPKEGGAATFFRVNIETGEKEQVDPCDAAKLEQEWRVNLMRFGMRFGQARRLFRSLKE